MQTFKDAAGEDWAISLNVSVVRKVRDELGVDLHSLGEETFAKLKTSDETLVDVISVICTEQINKRGLDEMGFAERLIGDVLDDAYEALMQELVFTSRHSRREVVAKAWQKVNEAEEQLAGKALAMMDSPKLQGLMDKAVQEMEERLGSL